MSAALSVEKLVKRFGSFTAVDGISFTVPTGSIVGLLGPNGAGKTTTMHMLLGITSPDGGAIRYFGKDFAANRQASLQRINFASSFNELLGRATVRENLLVFAELYQVPNGSRRVAELMDQFNLGSLANQRYWELSAGQKTRTHFVKSLLNNPELLLLDEPTASLDPDVADTVITVIEELRRDGRIAILYTSHNMAEITRICDDVIFMDRGTIVAHDTPAALTKRIRHATLTLTIPTGKRTLEQLAEKHSLPITFSASNQASVTIDDVEIPAFLRQIHDAKITINHIAIENPTLEDVFLDIARGGNRPTPN